MKKNSERNSLSSFSFQSQTVIRWKNVESLKFADGICTEFLRSFDIVVQFNFNFYKCSIWRCSGVKFLKQITSTTESEMLERIFIICQANGPESILALRVNSFWHIIKIIPKTSESLFDNPFSSYLRGLFYKNKV